MKLIVDKESDALYFRLDESSIIESEEVEPGIILDFKSAGVNKFDTFFLMQFHTAIFLTVQALSLHLN